MTKSILIKAVVFLCLATGSCAQDTVQSNEWHLVWSDEFTGEGLPDENKWSYEVGYIRNNEKQYYTRSRPENIRLEDGNLVIEARKEPYEGFEYTSASINTRESAAWIYGRIEVRAKLPAGTGMWPAIWMLGKNIDEAGWPVCGEIDIMEYVGFQPDSIYANVHTEAYNHTKGTQKGASIAVDQPDKEYNVYAVEWFEDRIDFYVNANQYFTFKRERNDDSVWPFDKPHYLLLNLAVGGTWGGQKGIDDDLFPQQYYIDYVRVYQKSREN